ncbi:MAG: translation elongation factor Ts [Erysipelotrichaceae bacterium]
MITAQSVKELRDKTGAGMMDCKKALTECDGDLSKSIDWLREKGISKAAKKADRIAAEGLSRVACVNNTAIIFEVNSETDFVAKNDQFLNLLEVLKTTFLNAKPADLQAALACVVDTKTVEELITETTATIGEKISLRRISVLNKNDNDIFGCYMHMGGKISAAVILKNSDNEEVAKDIAMQVASMSPLYLTRDDMPKDIVDHERSVQTEITNNDEKLANKPEKVLKGIIEGRVSKNLQDMCLVEQPFFKNPDLKVNQYLKEANTEVASFVRYAVGEGMSKREENFAEEVMNQIKK